MNLIFLDFDEVMNSIFFRHLNKNYIRAERNANPEIFKSENKNNPKVIDQHIALKAAEIDPEAMSLLSLIVERTNSQVVISSTWRNHAPFSSDSPEETIKRFKTLFEKLGYPDFPVIGFTGYVGFRGYEVAEFLDEYSKTNTVDKYLIIDDGADFFIDDLTVMTDEEIINYAGFHNNSSKPVFSDPDEFRKKSHFWSSQPLLRTSPAFGLSRQDAALAIGHFNPNDLLAEARRDYAPYVPNQGFYNSQEPEVTKAVAQFSKIKPR